MTDDDQRYFRDVYDHLIRIGDMVDTYRDLLTGAMDVYLSTVSNRLNAVMKQLAIIATVFMPLTFLTGFFGQNFGWMVAHVGGLGHFLVFGIGLELMTLAHRARLLLASRLAAQPVRPLRVDSAAHTRGTGIPARRSGDGTGASAWMTSGMCPAQTSSSASGVSPSSGPAGAHLRRRLVERQREDARRLQLLPRRLPRVGEAAGEQLLRERLERRVLLLGIGHRGRGAEHDDGAVVHRVLEHGPGEHDAVERA